MERRLLYTALCELARTITRVYFRRIEVEGLDRLPRHGPVILAANHPQSITDALVLAVSSPRTVRFVAHSGLFRKRFLRTLMQNGGAIPIHRPDDVQDAGERNRDSFRACVDVLAEGGCIGIFPEGVSAHEPRVHRLKTGTVRIALQAESEHDFGLGVAIVPVGLGFQSALRFRSRVLVTFGRPIRVADARADFERAPEDTVVALTEKLQRRLRHHVVHLERQDLQAFVHDVERVYSGELLQREGLDIEGHSRFAREQTLSREIARAADDFFERKPEVIANIRALLDEYHRLLGRLRLPDEIVREEGHSFRGEALRLAALGVLGLPLWLWGTIWNILPYELTGRAAQRVAGDHTKVHWWQLAFGSLLFPAFYAAWTLFAIERFDTIGAIVFMASLPPAGLFARWYHRALVRRRRHLRWAALRGGRGILARRVLDLRAAIIDAMNAALADHLSRHAPVDPPPEAEAR